MLSIISVTAGLHGMPKSEIDQTELVRLMAGGSELAALEHELEQIKAEVGS